MSGFSHQWLALREAADHRSRCEFIKELQRLHSDRLRVVDLGTGTGSNLRYLAARLPGTPQWICVDHDAALLSTIDHPATKLRRDLASGIDSLLQDMQRDLHRDLHRDGQLLVTASALLDLVSADWVDTLASTCAELNSPALFALTYDGRIELTPARDEDAHVINAVNQHQLGDKGFGPALGPGAVDYTRDAFAQSGYDVHLARSDWILDSNDRELQRELLDGWLAAATEVIGNQPTLLGWRAQRDAAISSGQLRIRVGHTDLFALPV